MQDYLASTSGHASVFGTTPETEEIIPSPDPELPWKGMFGTQPDKFLNKPPVTGKEDLLTDPYAPAPGYEPPPYIAPFGSKEDMLTNPYTPAPEVLGMDKPAVRPPWKGMFGVEEEEYKPRPKPEPTYPFRPKPELEPGPAFNIGDLSGAQLPERPTPPVFNIDKQVKEPSAPDLSDIVNPYNPPFGSKEDFFGLTDAMPAPGYKPPGTDKPFFKEPIKGLGMESYVPPIDDVSDIPGPTGVDLTLLGQGTHPALTGQLHMPAWSGSFGADWIPTYMEQFADVDEPSDMINSLFDFIASGGNLETGELPDVPDAPDDQWQAGDPVQYDADGDGDIDFQDLQLGQQQLLQSYNEGFGSSANQGFGSQEYQDYTTNILAQLSPQINYDINDDGIINVQDFESLEMGSDIGNQMISSLPYLQSQWDAWGLRSVDEIMQGIPIDEFYQLLQTQPAQEFAGGGGMGGQLARQLYYPGDSGGFAGTGSGIGGGNFLQQLLGGLGG